MGKGYNNYMCKKPFHPGSKENIKRAWMAEQKTENEKRKQEELKQQYDKEQDLYNNKAMISLESKDKLELNFMYEAPPGAKRERQKEDDEPEYKFEWQRKYNAPREDYAKGNEDIKDQPFGIAVRNVRCIKCHKWGHINTDRECPLFSQASSSSMPTTSMDPMDLMKQMKEDGYGLKEHVLGHRMNPKAANQQFVASDESDPEAEFLNSLSMVDKKKLLRKLKKLSKKQAKLKQKKRKKKLKSKKDRDSSDSDLESPKPKRKTKKPKTSTWDSSDDEAYKEKEPSDSQSESSESDRKKKKKKKRLKKTQASSDSLSSSESEQETRRKKSDKRHKSGRELPKKDSKTEICSHKMHKSSKHHDDSSSSESELETKHKKLEKRHTSSNEKSQNGLKTNERAHKVPLQRSSKRRDGSSSCESEHKKHKSSRGKSKKDPKTEGSWHNIPLQKSSKHREERSEKEKGNLKPHCKDCSDGKSGKDYHENPKANKYIEESRHKEHDDEKSHKHSKKHKSDKSHYSDDSSPPTKKSKTENSPRPKHTESKHKDSTDTSSSKTRTEKSTMHLDEECLSSGSKTLTKPERADKHADKVEDAKNTNAKTECKELNVDETSQPDHPDGFRHSCPQAVLKSNYAASDEEYSGKQHDKFRHVNRDKRSPSVKQKYNT